MTIDTCEELDDAVEEYLEHRSFPNTLECFRSETRHRKLLRCVLRLSAVCVSYVQRLLSRIFRPPHTTTRFSMHSWALRRVLFSNLMCTCPAWFWYAITVYNTRLGVPNERMLS